MGINKAYLLEEVEALLHLVYAAVLEQPLVIAIKASQKYDSLKHNRRKPRRSGQKKVEKVTTRQHILGTQKITKSFSTSS